MASFECIDRHVQNGHVIGHEKRVEFGALQFLDGFLDMREVEIHVRPGAGIAPRTGMNTGRPHESAEMKLAARWHREILLSSG
jgi:hypothetical protein